MEGQHCHCPLWPWRQIPAQVPPHTPDRSELATVWLRCTSRWHSPWVLDLRRDPAAGQPWLAQTPGHGHLAFLQGAGAPPSLWAPHSPSDAREIGPRPSPLRGPCGEDGEHGQGHWARAGHCYGRCEERWCASGAVPPQSVKLARCMALRCPGEPGSNRGTLVPTGTAPASGPSPHTGLGSA